MLMHTCARRFTCRFYAPRCFDQHASGAPQHEQQQDQQHEQQQLLQQAGRAGNWPPAPSPHLLGWITDAWSVSELDLAHHCGLKSALYLRLLAMSARLVALLGLITLLLVLPANLAGEWQQQAVLHAVCDVLAAGAASHV